MKRFLYILPLCLLLLGCSKGPELSGQTYNLQMPTSAYQIANVTIPVEYPISVTDGINYFELTDGSKVYRMTGNINFTEDKDVIFSKVKLDDDWQAVLSFKDKISNDLVQVEVINLPERDINVIEYCKDFENMYNSMEMTDSNMYMPVSDAYQTLAIPNVDLILDKSGNFIEAWIQDGLRDEIISMMELYVACNNEYSTLDIYDTEDIIVMYQGNRLIAAKKLMDNEWCIYHCNDFYHDYVLTAMNNVTSNMVSSDKDKTVVITESMYYSNK